MDYLNECLALGVDLIILGVCVKEYLGYKKTIHLLKSAQQYIINDELKNHVAKQKGNKIPYAIIRGTVTPIGAPIRSVLSPTVTGVLQVIKLREHRITRGFAGFWTEQSKLIHVSSNEMPFELRSKDHAVEIVDSLSSAIVDMDVVYDNYEPSSLSFFDHIFGFFSGVRYKGLQTTEEVLRDGSFITAFGELELDGKTLRMQSSNMGPLILTTATKSSLIKKFEDSKSSMMVKIVICGAISALILGIIARKMYRRKKQEWNERRIKETLEKERKERRTRSRPLTLTSEQLCVVCVTNPKEIIILPCGHVCICEDCSEKINVFCPVCRGNIVLKAAAFIA